MTSFVAALDQQLDDLRARGLERELRRVDSPQGPRILLQGRPLLNFSSNDYLGLANEPALKAAARQAIDQYGAGSGASRLICGSLAPHHELEQTLAEFKGAEAALAFSTGYATALGTIGALLGKDDIIILDKLVHASMVDAARLCGAKLRVFGHNDLQDLEEILQWANRRPGAADPAPARRPRILIVTESLFSMDGDVAPLREIVALKEQYGAWLMLDEAHATGLFGPNRRGLAEALGVADRVEIQMGTLGKAFGAAGGYICGARALIQVLVNCARSFIFSTAPPPAAAAAALAGLRLVQSAEGERRLGQLRARIEQATSNRGEIRNPKSEIRKKPEIRSPKSEEEVPPESAPPLMPQPPSTHPQDDSPKDGPPPSDLGFRISDFFRASDFGFRISPPILPLLVGDEARAVGWSAALRERGIYIPAIRYPTVARGAARLRLTLTAAHTAEDITQLLAALRDSQ